MQWLQTNQILIIRRWLSTSKIPSRAQLVEQISKNGAILVNPTAKKTEKTIISNPFFVDVADDNYSATQVFSNLNQIVTERKKDEEKGVLFYGTYSHVAKINSNLKSLSTEHIEQRMKVKKLEVLLVKAYQKSILSKYWIALDSKGESLSVKGLPNVEIVTDFISKLDKTQFPSQKSVVLMPFNYFVGMKSADQWKQKGIYIKELNNNIYPFFNVFPPTRSDYFSLFKNVIKQLNILSSVNTPVLDIGIGTGILSFLLCNMAEKMNPKKNLKIVGTDISSYAIECANFNAGHLGYKEQVNFVEADIFPPLSDQKYDLIVCNPPFISGTPATILEQGVYDDGSKILTSLFGGIKNFLSPNGKLVLLYSNISFLLGLQQEKIVEALCSKNGLKIIYKEESIAQELQARKTAKKQQELEKDPLWKHKKNEKLLLYVISTK